MTHSHRFLTLIRFASASSVCFGLLFACGGTTEDSNDDTSGPTDGGPTDGGPTDGGPTDGGPTDGGPTDGGPTDGGPTDGGPTTMGGNGGSGGGTNECPSIEPAAGSRCSEESQDCAYANCTAPDYRNSHGLRCNNGAWSLISDTPCEAVPSCPPNVVPGSYCAVPEGTGPCPAYDVCGGYGQVYCTDARWQFAVDGEDAAPPPDGYGGAGTSGDAALATYTATTGIPEPQCPVLPPTAGDMCCPNNYPEYCDYSESSSDSAVGLATSGSFTVVTTGSGGTSGIVAPTLTCAACNANMVWEASELCP